MTPGRLTALLFGVAVAVWFLRRPSGAPVAARALLVAAVACVWIALFTSDWLMLLALALFVGSLAVLYVSARRSRGT